MGDTAASNTSTTRLDFSSTVELIRVCPPVMTPMKISTPQMKGNRRAAPRCVRPSPFALTVMEVGGTTRSDA